MAKSKKSSKKEVVGEVIETKEVKQAPKKVSKKEEVKTSIYYVSVVVEAPEGKEIDFFDESLPGQQIDDIKIKSVESVEDEEALDTFGSNTSDPKEEDDEEDAEVDSDWEDDDDDEEEESEGSEIE